MPISPADKPLYRSAGFGNWDTFVVLSQLEFIGFKERTKCGAR